MFDVQLPRQYRKLLMQRAIADDQQPRSGIL